MDMVNLPLFFSRVFLYFHPNKTLNRQPISVDCFDKQENKHLESNKAIPGFKFSRDKTETTPCPGFEIKEIEIQQKCIWTNQKSSTKNTEFIEHF